MGLRRTRVAMIDMVALAGAGALVYGAALVTPALGWIVGGGMALGAALLWTRYAPKGDEP